MKGMQADRDKKALQHQAEVARVRTTQHECLHGAHESAESAENIELNQVGYYFWK